MASQRTHVVVDQVKKGLLWLVWKPWRLVVLIVAIVIVAIIASSLGGQKQGDVNPSGSGTIEALPAGWMDWPVTPVVAGQVPASTEPTVNATLTPAVTESSVDATPSATPSPPASSQEPEMVSENGPSDVITPGQPVWDTKSRTEAQRTGIQAVTYYLDGAQDKLNELLGYEIVIPCNPDPHVALKFASADNPAEAGPRVGSERDPLQTKVIIPTTAGDYTVSISRYSMEDRWLVQGLHEPGE